MLLTGTPLQNTVEELFSLLHFLEPTQFPSETEFLKDFGDLKTEEQVRFAYTDHNHRCCFTSTALQFTEHYFFYFFFVAPQVQKLQAILKPMMLRRLKEDVEKNLAPKQETIIEVRSECVTVYTLCNIEDSKPRSGLAPSQVELTDIQKKYYRAILERNFSFLSLGASSNSNVPNLLNTMMELRKCCNHPYLINGKGLLCNLLLLRNSTFRLH